MSACIRIATGVGAPRTGRGAAAGPASGGAPLLPRARATRARRCSCRSAADERPVFVLEHRRTPELTLEDIRDAYEVCSLIPAPGERSQCYSCFGLDGDRMATYYDAVLGLEAALCSEPQQQPQARGRGGASVTASMAE